MEQNADGDNINFFNKSIEIIPCVKYNNREKYCHNIYDYNM